MKNWANRKQLNTDQAKQIAETLGMLDSPEVARDAASLGGEFYMRILPEQVAALHEQGLWEPLINSPLYSDNPMGGGHQVESRQLNLIANDLVRSR